MLEGDFRPGGTGREWCDPEVLQTVRRRSLAKLRHQVEPVEPAVLGRLVTHWQGVVRRRSGLDALLATVQMPAGVPVVSVAVGGGGPANAALFAARILALSDSALARRLTAFRRRQSEKVLEKDARLRAELEGSSS